MRFVVLGVIISFFFTGLLALFASELSGDKRAIAYFVFTIFAVDIMFTQSVRSTFVRNTRDEDAE